MQHDTAHTAEPILAVSELHVRIGDAELVSNLTLGIRRGEIHALVGESGSGKSLTALSILGLLPDQAHVTGSIMVRGSQIVGASPAEHVRIRRRHIGAVFQNPQGSLDPVRRIGSQIVEVLRSAQPHLSRTDARQTALDILDRMRLTAPEDFAARYPHELSGGQAQRAMLALALARKPALLIADEPTTALDVRVQAEILDLIAALAADGDVATLLITHDLGVVAQIADRVTIIRNGQTVETGATQAVLANPTQEYTRTLLSAVSHLPADVAPPPKNPAPVPERLRDDTDGATSLRDIEVRYGTAAPAVSGVNLTFPTGTVTAVVGESGAGKSTLARTLVGLERPAHGSVDLLGEPLPTRLRRRDRLRIAQTVGMVFQDPRASFNPQRRVGTTIPDSAAALEEVGLPADFAYRFPGQLSGGQLQRAAIARAIAPRANGNRPRLIIADEPTSALDAVVRKTIVNLLRRLQTIHGFTLIFVTHDLGLVADLADAVVVMREGRIIEYGWTNEVLRTPNAEYTAQLIRSVPTLPDITPESEHQEFAAHAPSPSSA